MRTCRLTACSALSIVLGRQAQKWPCKDSGSEAKRGAWRVDMHISTRPVGREEIHLWPAFLFKVFAEHIEKSNRKAYFCQTLWNNG